MCTRGESPQSLITLPTSVLCYLATDAINLKMHFEFGFALIIVGVTLLRPKCPPPSPGTACPLPIARNHNHGEAHTHRDTHTHTNTHADTRTHTHTQTRTHTHTRPHMHTHTHQQTRTHTDFQTHIRVISRRSSVRN